LVTDSSTVYTAFTDGGNRGGNPGRAAWGWVLYKHGVEIARDGNYNAYPRTNNWAEYTAVIRLLEWWHEAKAFGHYGLMIHSDSELIVNQLNGRFAVSDTMRPLWSEAQSLLLATNAGIKWIPRALNTVADSIVNQYEDLHEQVLGIQKKKRKKKNASA
jgi:ribonuclease HI